MKRGLKHDFTLLALMLIPIGVGVNVVVAYLVQLLRLPIYLDVIGTIFVSMIAGPWVGMVTGGLTNVIKSFMSPTELPYALVSIAIGLVAGYLSIKGMLSTMKRAIISGLIIMLVAVIVSTPISVLLFGGVTGDSASVVTTFFLASGQQIWQAVFTSNIITEIVDKVLSVLIAYLIVRKMSDRYLSKLNYGSLYINK